MNNALRRMCLFVALLPPLTLYADVPSKDLLRKTQILLLVNGFDPGPRDGVLGEKTKGAIRRYEAKHNWPITGQISTGLTERLRSETQDGLALNEPKGVPWGSKKNQASLEQEIVDIKRSIQELQDKKVCGELQTEARGSKDSELNGNNKTKQETTDELNRKIQSITRGFNHSESHLWSLDSSVRSSLSQMKNEIREHYSALVLFIVTVLFTLLGIIIAITGAIGVPKLIDWIMDKVNSSLKDLIKYTDYVISARLLADFSAHCVNLYKDFDRSNPKQDKLYNSYLDIAVNLSRYGYEKAEKLEQEKTLLSDDDKEVIDACINNNIYFLVERGGAQDKKVAQKLFGRLEKMALDYEASLKDRWWEVKETLTWVILKLGHKPVSEAVNILNTLLTDSTLPIRWREEIHEKYHEYLMADGTKLSDKFPLSKPTEP